MSVSSARGTTPVRWISRVSPAKSTTRALTIQVNVVRALRHSTGLNTGTAFDTASMPVIEVAPEANARRMTSRVSPSVAVTGGGGTGAKPRMPALANPTTSSSTTATMKMYVGAANRLPATRTPRRLPASRTAIASRPSGTVSGTSPGSAEVIALTPAATDTDTVST